jgi:hypothetical protein
MLKQLYKLLAASPRNYATVIVELYTALLRDRSKDPYASHRRDR